jgi:PleD family two-component response regulator
MSDKKISEGRVVIIEAEEYVTEMLQAPFEQANFDLRSATSGEAGIALCQQFLPQVVLVDADLSDVSGIQTCQRLRSSARTRHIHIVLLARSLDRQLRIDGLQTGADDFIVIPFDAAEVTLRVRNALRRAGFDNLTDPITGLPSGRLIQDRLRELVRGEEGWALLSLSVRYLTPFQESYGFLAAQEVLRATTRILAGESGQGGGAESFMGYNGGGRFLIVTTAEKAAAMSETLVAQFAQEAQLHYSFRDRERGHMLLRDGDDERQVPLMHLDVKRVLAADGPFYDIRSLTEAMG